MSEFDGRSRETTRRRRILFLFFSLNPDERKDGQNTRKKEQERRYSLPSTMNEKKMQEVILIKRSS